MKQIGFLGCGKIGKALLNNIIHDTNASICFIQDPFFTNDLNLSCPILNESDENLLKNADLVIECANASILTQNIEKILKHSDLLLFSVTAFADSAFEQQAKMLCQTYHRHIYIPHGAILGIDGIFDGRNCWKNVTIETTKSPQSLGRNDLETTIVFEGSTRDACLRFPRNVNVHAAIALCGIGFDQTRSRIISKPGLSSNNHLITLEGDGIHFQLSVSSFAAGSITGTYTPLSACGSLNRIFKHEHGIFYV